MGELTTIRWIAKRAARLGEHWHAVSRPELQAAAVEVRRDQRLHELPPAEAASRWLSPAGNR